MRWGSRSGYALKTTRIQEFLYVNGEPTGFLLQYRFKSL